MGNETIEVLELMTRGIKAVITHPTMTERLAAMLNYFLKTLTGPDRKNFKVLYHDHASRSISCFQFHQLLLRNLKISIALQFSRIFMFKLAHFQNK